MSDDVWIAVVGVLGILLGSGGIVHSWINGHTIRTAVSHQQSTGEVLRRRTSTIEAAVTPNGGSSMADKVDSIVTQLVKIEDQLHSDSERLSVIETYIKAVDPRRFRG